MQKFCHVNINTLPLYNWLQYNNDSNLKWLSKYGFNTPLNTLAYQLIIDSIVDSQGASQLYIDILKSKIKIDKLKTKALNSQDKNETFIQIEEIKLTDLLEQLNKEQNKLEPVLFYIETEMGFKINTKEITVLDFYNYIDFIQNGRKW